MERLGAFQSAFAVRQVEMGLAIMLSIVLGDRDAFWSSLARRTCVSAMDGRSGYRGRRFDAGFGDRDGLQRLFGSRNGDQYAGEGGACRMGDRAWRPDVAARWIGRPGGLRFCPRVTH